MVGLCLLVFLFRGCISVEVTTPYHKCTRLRRWGMAVLRLDVECKFLNVVLCSLRIMRGFFFSSSSFWGLYMACMLYVCIEMRVLGHGLSKKR